MADLYTDPFTGSNGSAWGASWTSDGTIQNNAGRLTTAAGDYSNVNAYLSGVAARTDSDVTITVTPATPNSEFYFLLNALSISGGGYASSGHYSAEMNRYGTISIFQVVSGTRTNLGTDYSQGTSLVQSAFKMRVAVVGGVLKAKAWPLLSAEPDWQTTGNTTGALSGRPGMGVSNGSGTGAGTVNLDDFRQTDGQSPYIEAWDGPDGAAWPARWTPLGDYQGIISGGQGRIQAATSQGYRSAAEYGSGIAAVADFDWTTSLTFSDAGEQNVYFGGRATSTSRDGGDGGMPQTGAGVRFSPSGNTIELVRCAAAGFTSLVSGSFTPTAGTPYTVRLKATGTTIQVKVWASSGAEPGAWTLTNTNASTPTAAGSPWYGIRGGADAVGRYILVDNLQNYSATAASGAIGLGTTASATATPRLTGAAGLGITASAVARPAVTGAVSVNMAPTGLVVYAASGATGLGITVSAVARPNVTGSATVSMAPTATAADLSRTGAVGLGAALAGSATPQVTGAMTVSLVSSAGATNTSYGSGAMSLQPSLTATAVNLSVTGSISLTMAATASGSSFYPTPPISPFDIKIWDVGNRYAGSITDPIYATFTPRFPGIGTGEIQVRSDSSLNMALQAPGASITVQYRKEHLFSGPVTSFNGSVVNGTITYQVADWWTLMKFTLAWVNPSNPLEVTAKGGAYQLGANANDPMHYYYGASSLPAETAIKKVVTDNFTRLGRKVSIEPDQGRGGTITPPVTRFNTLQEVTETIAGSALWPRIRQVGGAGLIFEVNPSVTFPQVFTAQSGTVSEGTFSAQGPAATRVVLGGPGQDTDRAFFARNDTTGLESAYGYAIEVFKDATSGTIDWPDEYADALKITREYLVNPDVAAANKASFLTTINESGKDALADGSPTSGLQVTLSEGDGFHYGGSDGYHVGDTITVAVVGQVITEQVTECSISWSTSGLAVTPTLGQQSDDPSVLLYQTVVAIAAGLRRGSLRK